MVTYVFGAVSNTYLGYLGILQVSSSNLNLIETFQHFTIVLPSAVELPYASNTNPTLSPD